MIDVILDAFLDSLKAFVFIFVIYIILSFLEFKIANKLSKNSKMSPFYGSIIGLIPQCGVSVVASDLYLKKHISVGTLLATFLSCSDEALPLILSSGDKRVLIAIPLVITKFFVGFIVGFLVDLFISKKEVNNHLDNCDHHDIEIHTGCCHHHIDDEREDGFDKHIWHPFLHSLKLFMYVLIISIIFGLFIYFIGEENFSNFIQSNRYISPLLAILLGLIPNCASSIILTELYLNEAISFGATLAGLCVNAGLGLVFLFKDKKNIKRNISILITLILSSLIVGYLTCIISGF